MNSNEAGGRPSSGRPSADVDARLYYVPGDTIVDASGEPLTILEVERSRVLAAASRLRDSPRWLAVDAICRAGISWSGPILEEGLAETSEP